MVINGLSALRTVFFFSEIMSVCAHTDTHLCFGVLQEYPVIQNQLILNYTHEKVVWFMNFFLNFVKISESGHLLNQFHCFSLQWLCPLRHQMEMMDLHFWKSLPLVKNSLFPPRIHHPGGQSTAQRRIVSKARDLSFAAGL